MSWIDVVAAKVGDGTVQAGGGADEPAIARAELVIGPLPASYRMFVSEFGFVTINADEIFGLSDSIPSYLDVVRVTLAERDDSPGFPSIWNSSDERRRWESLLFRWCTA